MAQTNESRQYLLNRHEELKEAFDNGTLNEWLNEQLDVTQYYVRYDGEFEYSHSEILITCNGPDIRLYTDKKILVYSDGHERDEMYVFSEIIDELDSLLEL